MKIFDFLPRRINVLHSQTNQQIGWMKQADAISAMRDGRIEEIYSAEGAFMGVTLCEKAAPNPAEAFYRGSLTLSKSTLTDKDVEANVGAAKPLKVRRVQEKVAAWPFEHDDLAVVISAGRVCRPALCIS